MSEVPPVAAPTSGGEAHTEVDTDTVGDYFAPNGGWAQRCGDQVRLRRTRLGVTSPDLARRCRISTATLWKIEAGQIVPSFRLRAVLAFHLRTAPERLWRSPSRTELKRVVR